MVRIKICGITNVKDALTAVEFGADALGFVFYEGSPRCTTPRRVREIIRQVPPFITTVGVFVNEGPDRIREIMGTTGLNTVQLHGDEPQGLCNLWPRVIKAFRVRHITDLELLKKYCISAYLLDTYTEESFGGTGQLFNWDIAVEAKQFGRVILAGGLTPENIERAVKYVLPYAVDVSSGVEKEKGRKDPGKMKAFIESAKKAFLSRTPSKP